MAEKKGRSGLTQTEEKELHRVFDHLANYPAKRDIYAILNPKSERRSKIISHKKSPSVFKVLDEECKDYEAQIAALDNNPDRKIRPIDLQECLKDLGRPCTKKEIEDMIWEVDENLDGCVDWKEFYLMFTRNINDSSGLEPSQLFSVVQFMMFDKDGGGTVSADECMEMIYMRYGKDQLEAKMADLFAADDGDAATKSQVTGNPTYHGD
eukprot:g1781.t1